MKIVNQEDLDMMLLDVLGQGKEGVLLHDEKNVYKFFREITDLSLTEKERKLIILDGILPENFTGPKSLIYKNNEFSGYTMDYIKDSINLLEFSIRPNTDKSKVKDILLKVSDSLKRLHNLDENIIVGDLNPRNILVDKTYTPHIIDVDSFKINGYICNCYPLFLRVYLGNRDIPLKLSKETDKLCLSLIGMVLQFLKNLDSIGVEEYEEKANHNTLLKELYPYFRYLKEYDKTSFPDVMYLDELFEKTLIKKYN